MSDPHADSERLRDDLAAYAIGAIAGDEAAELERHLDGCESCRERLQWLRPAVDQLPAAVPQLSPPESLRESLMATVRAEAAPPATAAAPPRRTRRWWQGLGATMLRPATGFAALILVVAGVAGGYLLRGDAEEPASQQIAAERLAAAEVSATLERHGDSATLHVHELPQLGRDEVYEVWVQRAGVMEPSTTFVLESDGSAAAAVPGPLEGASAIYVTEEPRGGSRQPTTEPLLKAELS